MAFLIYLFHSNCHLGCTYGIMTDFISRGSIAMTGFFMLSGYALNLAYGNKELSSWSEMKNFYLKRFVSIYPLYIVVGTVFSIMMITAGKQTIIDNLILFPIELLGLQSMFSGALFSYAHNSGTWFVSCLFLCYLLFPVFITWIKQLNGRNKVILLGVLLALLIGIPKIATRFSEPGMYTNPFYRMMEFSLGVILSQLNGVSEKKTKLTHILLLITSICILLIGVTKFSGIRTAVVETCFAIIIFTIARIPFNGIRQSKAVKYLSAISYAFFLGQFFVWNTLKFVMQYTGRLSNITLILISFILCLSISILLHELIEKKASKFLKHKLS